MHTPQPDFGDQLSAGLAGDVEFYCRLALQAPPPVLELGCGTGRVTLPVARAGVRIVGLDSSGELIAAARARSEGIANLRWIQADMRSFTLPERFGLIFVPYRAFQYLLGDHDQQATLDCIFEHLLPGGRLALNIFNASILDVLTRSPSGPLGPRASNREQKRQRTRPLLSRTHAGFRLRYISREEMSVLLRRTGFEVEALYGWFDGRPFNELSTEMVWIARRPSKPVGRGRKYANASGNENGVREGRAASWTTSRTGRWTRRQRHGRRCRARSGWLSRLRRLAGLLLHRLRRQGLCRRAAAERPGAAPKAEDDDERQHDNKKAEHDAGPQPAGVRCIAAPVATVVAAATEQSQQYNHDENDEKGVSAAV